MMLEASRIGTTGRLPRGGATHLPSAFLISRAWHLGESSIWCFHPFRKFTRFLRSIYGFFTQKVVRKEYNRCVRGLGIPPTHLSALFTKYHRLPGEATRGIHGSGLGLLIVKEIVKAHGGTVRAESEGLGKGTTFIVSIPLEQTAE